MTTTQFGVLFPPESLTGFDRFVTLALSKVLGRERSQSVLQAVGDRHDVVR